MFYNKEQVDNHLNCKNCNKRFDLPRLLSCGEVICETCLNNIKNIGNTANEIKCPFCNVAHIVPKNGFPIQKVLLNLLKIQPLDKFRGVLVEELDEATKELSRRLNVLNSFNESSQNKIKENGTQLRKKIADNAEKKRNELRDIETKLNSKMDAYEKDANEQIKLILNKFLEDSEPKLKIWNDLAENATIENEKGLLTSINHVSEFMKKVTIQEQSLKKLIDNIEIIYFYENKAKINESIIGKLNANNNESKADDDDEDSSKNDETEEKLNGNGSTNQQSNGSADPNALECKTQ